MGYTITIGNAVLQYTAEDLHLRIEVLGANHPEAPDHDVFTGISSSRSPSYTVWSNFCRDAGISVLFYGGGWDRTAGKYVPCPDVFHRETPLMAHHPGVQPLCRADLDFVRAARIKREQANGGKPPGFWEGPMGQEKDNGTDSILARLLWLEFWFEWALDNCTIPAIGNT